MARIAGIDIPREKRVEASLRYIHGIGSKRASDICDDLNIDRATRVTNLTNDEVAKIRKYIEANYRVEGDLRRDVSQNIRRKTEIGSYQGSRHRLGLPEGVKELIQMLEQEKVLGLQLQERRKYLSSG